MSHFYEERRIKLSLNFAKKCDKNPCFKNMFKKNSKEHDMKLRHTDIIEINHCNTSRYYNSAIPFMKRQLNRHYLEKEQDKLNTH